MYSTFIAELPSDRNMQEIENINKVYGKAQRYANTGFKLIEGMFEKSEETVRLELLKELDDMYKSITDEQL